MLSSEPRGFTDGLQCNEAKHYAQKWVKAGFTCSGRCPLVAMVGAAVVAKYLLAAPAGDLEAPTRGDVV